MGELTRVDRHEKCKFTTAIGDGRKMDFVKTENNYLTLRTKKCIQNNICSELQLQLECGTKTESEYWQLTKPKNVNDNAFFIVSNIYWPYATIPTVTDKNYDREMITKKAQIFNIFE